MTLAVSLTLGIFSGLPPLKETMSTTKEAGAANGVYKAWNWDTKDEFVKYVKKNYTNKYGTVFNANDSHVFTNGNLKINLAEKIPIPGTETKVCKWWWFTTVDKYGDSRSSSTGTTHKIYEKLDIENPIIRINTAFKGCSSLEKISVLPRIYHN